MIETRVDLAGWIFFGIPLTSQSLLYSPSLRTGSASECHVSGLYHERRYINVEIRYDTIRQTSARDAKPRRKSMKKKALIDNVECGGDVEETEAGNKLMADDGISWTQQPKSRANTSLARKTIKGATFIERVKRGSEGSLSINSLK